MSMSTSMRNIPQVRKLSGLDDGNAAQIILGIYHSKKTQNTKIFVFSDNIAYKNGERLANYIKKYKLGDIAETKTTRNPNNGNTIKTWMWSVYRKGLESWAENRKDDPYTSHY